MPQACNQVIGLMPATASTKHPFHKAITGQLKTKLRNKTITNPVSASVNDFITHTPLLFQLLV